MNDFDRCRVSEEELSHALEERHYSQLYAEAERVAERMIGNFDEIGDLISALAGADDATLRGLVKAISERHPSIVGLLPILKAEFVRQVLEDL